MEAVLGRGDRCGRDKQSVITDVIAEMEWWAAFRKGGQVSRKPKQGNQAAASANGTPSPTKVHKKPWRNAPCPCGSGKKHKHCCGKAEGTKRPIADEAGGCHPHSQRRSRTAYPATMRAGWLRLKSSSPTGESKGPPGRPPRPSLRLSGPHFNHRVQRSVLVPNIFVRQQVRYPFSIPHQLVFIAAWSEFDCHLPMAVLVPLHGCRVS